MVIMWLTAVTELEDSTAKWSHDLWGCVGYNCILQSGSTSRHINILISNTGLHFKVNYRGMIIIPGVMTLYCGRILLINIWPQMSIQYIKGGGGVK